MQVLEMNDQSPTDDIVEFLKMSLLSNAKKDTSLDLIVLDIKRYFVFDQQDIYKRFIGTDLRNPQPALMI